MEWNAIANFIRPELLLVVAVCWAVGYTLKKTPRVPDWTIIYAVTIFAVGVVIAVSGVNVDSVLQGVLCGAVAVYGNQLIKQSRKAGDE